MHLFSFELPRPTSAKTKCVMMSVGRHGQSFQEKKKIDLPFTSTCSFMDASNKEAMVKLSWRGIDGVTRTETATVIKVKALINIQDITSLHDMIMSSLPAEPPWKPPPTRPATPTPTPTPTTMLAEEKDKDNDDDDDVWVDITTLNRPINKFFLIK